MEQAPPCLDQGFSTLRGYCCILRAPFQQLGNCMVPTEQDGIASGFILLRCPLLSSNSCSFFLGSPFPSLSVSSPCACSKPSLLNCLHVFFYFFFNERAIQTEPCECQAKFLKQAFSSGRRPEHIHSLIGPLADTQLTPLLLYSR